MATLNVAAVDQYIGALKNGTESSFDSLLPSAMIRYLEALKAICGEEPDLDQYFGGILEPYPVADYHRVLSDRKDPLKIHDKITMKAIFG